ncbi:DUF6544 family protein [Halococcus hamelinensis]|uniref:Uncharacterized protein n=1 Tax=Halococcus hamelinensis 100A6 TaxID=1132509 RepID=M0LX51_9EURY|nr:DUF6544 family protein [Halococcus hamelinensis]EMA37753.1 hypothetical protein C447_12295 [Halococcus hamelinensis 100A6]
MPDSSTARRVALALAGVGGVLSAVRFHDGRTLRKRRQTLRSERAADETFDPDSIADLPSAAERYLRHAIASGTPLARQVELTMDGEVRLGDRWLPFTAEETLAARCGFVWRPTVRFGFGLWFSGADFHVDGTGGQRFALAGLIPIVRADGPAIDRSSAGRFLAESVWLPTSLLPSMGAEWEGVDDRRARVALPTVEKPLTVTVNEEGAVKSVTTRRLDGDTGEMRPFGASIERERTVDGVTIPARLEVGWGFGTDEYEPFFRAELRDVSFY